MIVLLIVVWFVFAAALIFGYLKLNAQNESILQWVMHVNDKLTRIEIDHATVAAKVVKVDGQLIGESH